MSQIISFKSDLGHLEIWNFLFYCLRHTEKYPVNVIRYRAHINLSRVLQIVLTNWSGLIRVFELKFPCFVSNVRNAHHKTTEIKIVKMSMVKIMSR